MHLFYYLYVAVGAIPTLQTKVMRLKAYLQSQKLETPSVFPTESLFDIGTPTSLDTDLITTGTGTTGDTMTHISGTATTVGTLSEAGIGTGGIMIIIFTIFLLGHLLDRELNRRQDLNQELQKLQDQDNQENQNHE